MILFTYKKNNTNVYAKKKAEEGDLKSSFLANMSHEIRTYERYFRVYSLLKRKITGDEQQYISVIEKRAIECLIS
jgi:signal transduction histidine kinase